MKRLLCLLLALCMVLSLTACGGEQPESIQLFAMDTVMDLTCLLYTSPSPRDS